MGAVPGRGLAAAQDPSEFARAGTGVGRDRTGDRVPFRVVGGRIVFRDSQGRDGSVELTGTEIIYVGRGLECAIRTDDAMVSRRHSQIRMENGRFVVEDLGSANGTLVNNNRVQKQALAHNDVVQCGSLWIRFFDDGGAGVAASPGAAPVKKGGTMVLEQADRPLASGGAMPGVPPKPVSSAAPVPGPAPGYGAAPAQAPYGGPPAMPAGGGGAPAYGGPPAMPGAGAGPYGGPPAMPGGGGAPGPYGGPPAMPGPAAPGAFGGPPAMPVTSPARGFGGSAGAASAAPALPYGGPPSLPGGGTGAGLPYGGPPSLPGAGPPSMFDRGPAGGAAPGAAPGAPPPARSKPDSVLVDLGLEADSGKLSADLKALRAELDEARGNYEREVADAKRIRAESAGLRDRIEELKSTIKDREEQIGAHGRAADELREEIDE
ncbi:MAG: FHA domain-containing protein, partial [Kofleriaceae bacterium]|nr:FHA domain-containing protein [Kofleriaceae bacterium]